MWLINMGGVTRNFYLFFFSTHLRPLPSMPSSSPFLLHFLFVFFSYSSFHSFSYLLHHLTGEKYLLFVFGALALLSARETTGHYQYANLISSTVFGVAMLAPIIFLPKAIINSIDTPTHTFRSGRFISLQWC